MNEVLALNSSYEPLAFINWRRAVTLVFSGKAEILEVYGHSIRSPSVTIAAPAVIRIARAVIQRYSAMKFSRYNVYLRDGGVCQYCRQYIERHAFTIDHVVPRQNGGKSSWQNVVTACVDCNRKKGGRSPEEARMPLVAKPTIPVRKCLYKTHQSSWPSIWGRWLSN